MRPWKMMYLDHSKLYIRVAVWAGQCVCRGFPKPLLQGCRGMAGTHPVQTASRCVGQWHLRWKMMYLDHSKLYIRVAVWAGQCVCRGFPKPLLQGCRGMAGTHPVQTASRCVGQWHLRPRLRDCMGMGRTWKVQAMHFVRQCASQPRSRPLWRRCSLMFRTRPI